MKVQNYILETQIGAGSFSTVYKAFNKEDKKYYAIKSMREMHHNNEKVVQNEIDLLKKVEHNNIVRYVTDFKEKGKWYIVFEYCGKGDLRKFKEKQGRLPQMFCKNLAHSLVSVLALLHKNNIVHRDLKLENILINDNLDFKLADFGFSKDNDQELMVSFCGTPSAMAPEILKREPYDDRCDTWSLGVMLFEMVYGRLPFVPNKKYGLNIYGLTNCVLDSEPVYQKGVSEQCLDFIKQCLRKDKNTRPRMQALMNHVWLMDSTSKIRRQYIQDCMQDKTQIVNKIKQVFHGSIQEHIRYIIVQFHLLDAEIRKYIGYFDKYYPERTDTKFQLIMMIGKIIKEINESYILIEIQGFHFQVKLRNIKSFQDHINNLKEFLNSQRPLNVELEPKINLERKVIIFMVNEAESCLKLSENFPEKNQLIKYISKLPMKKFMPSKITIQWSFKEEGTSNRRIFCENLEKLQENEIIKFANEYYADEDLKLNWLIQHQKNQERRPGEEILLGQYVNRIIEINMDQDY